MLSGGPFDAAQAFFDRLVARIDRLEAEVGQLKAAAAAQASAPNHAGKLCTIAYFMEMAGYKSKVSYYNHLDDEGWPQRIYRTGRPMLRYDDCKAYLDGRSGKPEGAFVKSKPGQGTRADEPRRRHPGRPAKLHPRA